MPSTDPNWIRSSAAVFSPIPGTPSMLSEVSPLSAMKSGICSGLMPYRWRMRSGVYTTTSATPRGVIMMLTWSEASWKASRSVETTHTLCPACSNCADSVPITSSASIPSARTLR